MLLLIYILLPGLISISRSGHMLYMTNTNNIKLNLGNKYLHIYLTNIYIDRPHECIKWFNLSKIVYVSPFQMIACIIVIYRIHILNAALQQSNKRNVSFCIR